MRLIATSNLTVVEQVGYRVPPYGILSHTWEDAEVTYQDMLSGQASRKKGYSKIEMACKQAARDGLEFVWVDTCCIDKTSSAELSEAINSMFQWYKDSAICYVYLSDLDPSNDTSTSLRHCRWFTRGWTLQELVAPRKIQFFDRDWGLRGAEKDLLPQLSQTTGISPAVLAHQVSLGSIPVAVRMSWASGRQTTKLEDLSYCLLGIFNINMPPIYGEGARAFRRLQEEIIKDSHDLSIFAWTAEMRPRSVHPAPSGAPIRH
ncbi:heterokaryon incompatibility protein-domain-containing protein [Immersiella caudata]|uniref:Heterokaryon incompatibility protein-domain-containing protein n=1 Tax=Immersiella caudata TaxID=314043 RepID=A0AA39XIK7_9PEZI|nr:heterokaryon incompatibility protein-domain-containing protein [Immersiella caudata]